MAAEPRMRVAFALPGEEEGDDKRRSVWECDFFTADMCEALLTRHGEHYGEYASTFAHLLESLLTKTFSEPTIRHGIIKMVQALQRSESIFRRRQLHMAWSIPFHLSRICDEICKQLYNSSVGDLHIFPIEVMQSGLAVVTQERQGFFTVAVVNVNPMSTAYHPFSSERPPKLLMQTVLEIKNVPKQRVTSEAFWACDILSETADDMVVYTHILPWLNGKTHNEILEDSEDNKYASGSKSEHGNLWKTFVHAFKYVLQMQGDISGGNIKAVRLMIKQRLLSMCLNDMKDMVSIQHSVRLVIRAASNNAALALARNGKELSDEDFREMRDLIDKVHTKVVELPCPDEDTTKPPPLLNITSGWEKTQRLDLHPLAEVHRRLENTDDFIGQANEMPRYVPVNFLRLASSVRNIDDAINLIDDTVALCNRIINQSVVKNQALLMCSLLTHIFVDVLPMPLGPKSRAASGASCIWAPPSILYGQQLHLMMRLWQCCEFFMWSSFSIKTQKEFDAQRIIVLGAMATISDAVIRLIASDHPSVMSVHLRGYKRKPGFVVTAGKLATQTENSVVVYPELTVTRAGILDYHSEMADEVPSGNLIWAWEDSNSICKGTTALFRQICHAEGFRVQAAINYFTTDSDGPYCVVGKYWEELRYHRNLYICYKWMMAAKNKLPTCTTCMQCRVAPPVLSVDLAHFRFSMRYMHKDIVAKAQQLRFPSFAIPSRFTAPFEAFTEDDLLHIKNLPTFDDCMGQRDSELLLSYLTAPYLRIPLVLQFFATEDRVSCLGNATIRNLLEATLFEPGRFLARNLQEKIPLQVPSEDSNLLSTPFGLLFNEFQFSPDGVIRPLVQLVKLAREMDAGTVYNTSVVEIILFLMRTAARVENYLSMVLSIGRRQAEKSCSPLRGVDLDDAQLKRIAASHKELRFIIEKEMVPMLEAWNEEVMADVVRNAENSSDIDKATRISCDLQAHILLMLRNLKPNEWDRDKMSLVLSAIMFLTTRHTFNTESMVIPETELYDILQRHRRSMTSWLYQQTSTELGLVMDSVVRIATSTGKRTEGTSFAWGYVSGVDCIGRFSRVDDDNARKPGHDAMRPALIQSLKIGLGLDSLPQPSVVCIDEGQQDVEINVHTLSLTFKAAHLIALPSDIAHQSDVMYVFGSKVGGNMNMIQSMQCAVMQDAVNRQWVRLVGQEHDIQYWRTPDPRLPLPSDASRFFPDDLAPSEEWIQKLVEPIRRAFFTRSFWQPPIFILLPEHTLSTDQNTCILAAVCSKSGKKLKEIVALRDHNTVHVYDIFSVGRRWYRKLVYSTNAHFALRELEMSTSDRRSPWLPWQRHAGGEFEADESEEASVGPVILRHPTHPDNRSKSMETFLPKRILEGLIPDAILERYDFWQDPDDNIRGYPTTKDATDLIWIHWKDAGYEPIGGEKHICFQIFRFARAESAPKVSELAVLKSQKMTIVDELDEELERMRTTSTDTFEAEQQNVEEGMFRQSTTVYKPNVQSATIEDYNLLLVNILYAREGTPLHSLACVLSRVELLSHVLCWTTQVDYDPSAGGPVTLDLISLPRLKLSFSAKLDTDGNLQLFSMDHAHLFVSNLRPNRIHSLIQGIPHSLILSDVNHNVSILVPALHVVRPKIQTASFSTELVVNRSNKSWYTKLDTKYYLYPVHVSLSFLFTPTLASALYLLSLRFLHCEYESVFQLANSIGTDIEFTPEEEQNFNLLNFPDARPEAAACLSKVGLLVADSPVNLCWFLPKETASMIRNYNTIGLQCKLNDSEERRLLYICITLLKKLEIVSAVAENEKAEFLDNLVNRITTKQSVLQGTPSERKQVEEFFKKIARKIRDDLDIRITRDETTRLISIYHNNVRYEEFSPYYQCLLENRYAVLEAENKSIDNGGKPETAVLSVPKLGKEELWQYYKDYDPMTIKIPEAQPKVVNRENRAMKLSSLIDYFYCGAQVRKAGMCECHECAEECGPDQGCPCAPCKQKNKEELHRLRYLPQHIPQKSSRMMSFYEIFALVSNLYTQDQSVRDMWKQVRPELRQTSMLTRRLSMREDSNGFLQYYEMLTGTTKVRIGSIDCAKDLALLMFPLCYEARRPESALGHLMHYLINNPNVWSKLPKFNRTSKTSFETRMTQIYTSIMQQAGTNNRPVSDPPIPKNLRSFTREMSVVPRPETRANPFTPISETRILPVLSNTDCSKRVWSIYDVKLLVAEPSEKVALSSEVREMLVKQPLACVVPSGFLVFLDRAEQKSAKVGEDLPFDLGMHPAGTTTVAKNMIGRLAQDMKDFATQENQTKFARIQPLNSESVVTSVVREKGAALAGVVDQLNNLQAELVKLRDEDSLFVTHALTVAERTVNSTSTDTISSSKTRSLTSNHNQQFAESVMHLRRIANQEAHIGLAYMISCIACTTADRDWIQLNPFLSKERCEAVLNVVVTSLLRANRIGHVNRASESVKELIALLAKAQHLSSDDDDVTRNAREALTASIIQKSDSLAGILATKRVYINPATYEYDPRFLIFEFTWNLVLRSRQRALIEEIHSSICDDRSIVKQMIMGAGKTTVVGPILALMLANRQNLVIQVVPPALLDFTRSILRATFSCTIQKQIFCFNCDRSSEVDSEVLSKFIHAKQSRGIVVSTPSSIKSIFLKYIEGLDRIEDTSRPPLDNVEREVHDLQRVLTVWKDAVLVMDEVDMLLHPLKSELNFPIGEKHQLDFAPTRWKLPIHLIDALFYFHTRRISVSLKDSPEAHEILIEIREAIRAGLEVNALQSTPHLTLLNLEFYEQHLRSKMARWLLLFIKSHHFAGLSDEETLLYINTRPSATQNPSLNDRVSKLETDHIKTLNLSFEWLNAFLPHVMQKIDRVTFGIMNADDMKRAREDHPKMPRSRFVTAIPFIGKDLPSQSSEFAHPDVVIGLTIMAYRYEGLRKTDFTDIMRCVHQSVEKEVGRFHQRRTNIMYNKWVQASGGRILSSFAYGEKKVKDDEEDIGMQPSESFLFTDGDEGLKVNTKGQHDVLPLKLMRQANQDETDKLYRLFRRTAEVVHWYLCEKVFPEYMTHQRKKLSASGQELGGNIMFQRRIGFSGTPSDLLPYELGKCDYEPGTDGKLLHTLTSPLIMSYHVAEAGWTVRSLLDRIATANPPFHSLIDTGALVTGMSNLQVAQYLLKHGLPQMEAVVFLDEFDRKMILVRATGRVLKLAECGIPKVKRFAFYDQVHTTGMDIEHTPNAVAVQTLGKDMTFRDFSQGAYRMRGIGQGQRVHLLIIPEVFDLVQRTIKSMRRPGHTLSTQSVLNDVSAWLLVNSIRSEHTQHNQLCIQTICNVWRKEAYEILLKANSDGVFKRGGVFPPEVIDALHVFREPVDYTVPTFVPQPRMFSEAIGTMVAGHTAFIRTDEGKGVVQGIVDQTKREDEIDNPVIDVQMVQEQEEEREATQEQEKQQEIEMEKFVDLAYSRDEESSTPWALSSLSDFKRAVQFYKLENFHLYKRRAMNFPDYIMLSRNFFNPKWSGFRRLKNVIVAMEWIPNTDDATPFEFPLKDYGDVDPQLATEYLDKTLALVTEHQNGLSPELVRELVQLALGGAKGTEQDWKDLHSIKYAETLHRLLSSNFLRKEEQGRYTVSLSLAEAETIRRVMHARKNAGKPFLDSGNTQVCLTMVPSNNAVLDMTEGFRNAATASQRDRAFQCLRFFDSDLHYTEQDINFLLRSIHVTPPRQRQAFFLQLIQCRRRARQRWEKTPVSLLFSLSTPYTLLHERAIGLCLRRELSSRDIHLADAYLAFNSSHSGVLSPDELWGAMRFARMMGITAADVLDFIEVADTHHEGTIQYPDFLSMLTGSREIDDEEGGGLPGKDDSAARHLPDIPPHGGEELKDLRASREAVRRKEEEEANAAQASEDNRVRGEIEQEIMKEELAVIQTSLNPRLDQHSLHFSFQSRDIPKLSQFFGSVKPYQADVDFPMKYFQVPGDSSIKAQLRSIKLITGSTAMENYLLTFEFCLPKIRTIQGKDYRRTLLRIFEDIGESMQLFSFPTGAWEACPGFNTLGMHAGDDEDNQQDDDEDYDEDQYTDDDEDDYEESEESGDGDYKLYVYSEPRGERKHRIRRVHFGDYVVEEVGHRSNSSTGKTIEWMKISKPIEGYVPLEVGTRRYWRQEHAEVSITCSGQVNIDVSTGPRPEFPPTVFEELKDKDDEEDDGSSLSSWGDWYHDFDEAYECEEDEEEEEEEQFDMGDLTDLVAAIKKAKELRVGDKVSRNPECWDGRGNEDGGAGSVGKVTRVEEVRVHVQWANGFKATYKWGEAGQFELIKVGGEDDDDDWGREVANDDKWTALLKKNSGANIRCGNCAQNCHIEAGNGWFRCNQCPNFNLCKKCFKLMEHQEHLFTDMVGLLEQMRTTDIVRGSHVRIRPDIKEPAFGWQDAPRDGTPGVVSDLDEDQNTIQVHFNDEIWYGKLSEVVFVDLKAEERGTVWLGILYNLAPLSQATANRKKEWQCIYTVVDQQLSPPIVEGIFKVGQRVKAFNNNRYYPGEIRAVLPNSVYAIAFDDGSFHDKVPEDKIALNPFQKGVRVRIKTDADNFNYGLQRGVEKGMIGEVMDIYPYSWGSDRLRLRIKVRNGMRVVVQNIMDDEVDVVGDAKWYTRKRVKVSAPSTPTAAGAAFGEEEAAASAPTTVPVGDQIPLPKSAVPTVDRAFSDGVVSAEVYLRDATYTIHFERMEIINPKTNEVVGDLIRDPPQQWVKQREKVTFDDGKWHVLSVLIRGDQNVIAVCDGHTIPVEYNGPTFEDDDSDADEEEEEEEGTESGAESEPALCAPEEDADVVYAAQVDLHNIVDAAMIRLLAAKPDDTDKVFDTLVEGLEEYQRVADGGGMNFPAVSTGAFTAETSGCNASHEQQQEPSVEWPQAADEEAAEDSDDASSSAEADSSDSGTSSDEEAPAAWDTEVLPKKSKQDDSAKEAQRSSSSSSSDSTEDDDDEDDGRVKHLPTLKRHPKDVLTLDVRAGLTFMSLTSANLSGAERQRLGPDFPSRRLAKVSLHWGADATEEKATEVFRAIDKECQWTCGACAKENSRLANQCSECKRDRVEDLDANKNRKAKVIAVLPKSKEAQEFRKKMHARLRSQYQRQLEALDANFNGMSVI